jgi:poly-gamma-glutamate synthesis protein (capsule biosynthesis protein)
VLYGCGDFINDYEGIAGYEEFRGHLAVLYFVTVEAGGQLAEAEMVPLRIRRFRLNRASAEETTWLQQALDRESAKVGTRIRRSRHGLELAWDRR